MAERSGEEERRVGRHVTVRGSSLPPLIISLGMLFLTCSEAPTAFAQSSDDPCIAVGSAVAQGYALTPSLYKSCLTTFPFKPAQAKSILNTIWKALVNLYPYTDLAIKSPDDRLFSRVRLRKQLLRIQNTEYANDFDFHRDLTTTISKLNDGHTGWNANCYDLMASTYLMLPMVQVYSATRKANVVKVAPKSVFTTLKDIGIAAELNITANALNISSVELLADAEVLEINGIPATDYVTRAARQVGGYRDLQSRINSLFVRPSFDVPLGSSLNLGELMSPSLLPSNDTLKVKLKRKTSTTSETFEVPYLVIYVGDNFNDSSQFYELNCAATAASTGSASLDARGRRSPYNTPRERPLRSPRGRPEMYTTMEETTQPYQRLSNTSDFVQVVLLEDQKTAVMTIPDFTGKPTDNQSAGSTELDFADELLTGYSTLANSGASQLIIDLSNNGGGYAATAAFLTQLFFPTSGYPGFASQFKANLFAQKAYSEASALKDTASDYSYSSYEDLNGQPFNSSSDFFLPLTNRTYNNHTEPYSALFKLTDLFEFLQNSYYIDLPTAPLFDSTKIIILSNGLCFSTCALFSYQMRQLHNVTVVTIGGKSGAGPFAFSDGAVGFVVDDFAEFYGDDVTKLGLESNQYAPPALPVQGALRFTIAQAFGPKSSEIPQEFIYEPGQVKARYTEENVLSLPTLWKEVATYF